MGPLTLDQTLFVVVLLLDHSKKTQIFFETLSKKNFLKKKIFESTARFKVGRSSDDIKLLVIV